MKQIKSLRLTIFWLTIIFIIVALFALTIGQYLPVYFKNYKTQSNFYYLVFTGLPFAILLTLFGTLKREHSKYKNWTIGTLTVLSAGFSFFILMFIMFTIGFGAWTNETILYRNNDDKNITINQQIFDIGALGYGGRRTVKLKPLFVIFQTVENIDITKIDKAKWTYVNEDGDIHFP
jgi:hypothetical protein